MARHRTLLTLATALVLAALLGTPASAAEYRTIEGSVTYEERMAMPQGANLFVKLNDISRADAPAEWLAVVTVHASGSVPIPYRLPYDPEMIDPQGRYTVSARLEVNGKTIFRSTAVYRVLTHGAPDTADIVMVKVEP